MTTQSFAVLVGCRSQVKRRLLNLKKGLDNRGFWLRCAILRCIVMHERFRIDSQMPKKTFLVIWFISILYVFLNTKYLTK